MNIDLLQSEPSYRDLYISMDHTVILIGKSPVGTESFSGTMERFLVGIVDTFGRLVMTLKTNLIKFGKNTKRSEMRFYSEGHMVKIRAVEALTYNIVMHHNVDVPTGLNGSYLDAINAVENVYKNMDLQTSIDGCSSAIKRIYASVSRKETPKNDLKPVLSMMNTRLKAIETLQKTADKVLTDEKTLKAPFMNAYESMAEFRDVRAKLLGLEPYLLSTAQVTSAMESMNDHLTSIVSALKDTPTLMDQTFVKDLATLVGTMARMYEAFSVNASRQLALEHNHMLVIEALFETKTK